MRITTEPVISISEQGGDVRIDFELSEAQSVPVVVNWTASDGATRMGLDYENVLNRSFTFAPGQTTATVSFRLFDDADFEPTESFDVHIMSAIINGAQIPVSGITTVQILDNDPRPIDPNLLTNGSFESPTQAFGTWAAHSSVSGWTAIAGGTIETWNAFKGDRAANGSWRVLSGATDRSNYIELDFAEGRDGFYQDITTQSGKVYNLTFDARLREGWSADTQAIEVLWNGALVQTITPGSTAWAQQALNVTGTGGNDRLTIQEVASQGSDGIGALLDNFKLIASDVPPPPSFAVSSAPGVVEGNSGATPFTFTVARSGDLSGTNSVSYVVSGFGAYPADNQDFAGGGLPNGAVTFASGETTKTITVNIAGDTAIESDETFQIRLSGATNGAQISTATATATITNDDSPNPVLALTGAPGVVEGNSGLAPLTFTVTRTGDLGAAVTASYQVAGYGANAASFTDFAGGVLPNGTLSFAAGETVKTITINAFGDTTVEADESFVVTLFNLSGNTGVTTSEAIGVILNDDAATPPAGTNLLKNGSFDDTLQAAGTWAAHASVPGWSAIAGGAIETWNAFGGDHAPDGSWRVLAGATDKSNYAELDYVSGQDGFYQDIQTQAGQAYQLSFDARLREGWDASTQAIEILWNNSVVATRTPGSTSWAQQLVSFTGTGGNDRLTIQEVASQGADGIGALLDNFKLAATNTPIGSTISISGAPAVAEADIGLTEFTFTLARTGTVSGLESVWYTTKVSGTNPTDASDFANGEFPAGIAVFMPGQSTTTIKAYVLGDTAVEADETFTVTITNPLTAAQITVASATGTIVNDDTASPPAGASLLINGSFEETSQAAGTYAPHTSIPGWTAIAGATIETWNAYGGDHAPDGSWRVLAGATDKLNYLELDYANGRDGFYQDITTQSGKVYDLTFDARLREGWAADTQAIEVLWNGVVVATRTPGSTTWAQQLVNVTGTGGNDRLTIQEVASQGADGIGALLDNFKLIAAVGSAAAPEVLTFASLLPPEMIEQAAPAPAVMFEITAPLLVEDSVIPVATWEAGQLVGLVGVQAADALLAA